MPEIVYKIEQDDTWETIIKKNYGVDNRHIIPLLKDANKDKLNEQGGFKPGNEIIIPEIARSIRHKQTLKIGRQEIAQWTIGKTVPKGHLFSTFALDQFTALANKLTEDRFVLWCGSIFGFGKVESFEKVMKDEETEPKRLLEAYKKLRDSLIEGSFVNPPIRLYPQRLEGHLAKYDSRENVIKIHENVARQAEKSDKEAWKLLIILVEEFGHHVDYVVRNEYSDVGGDAPNDEGACFAYALPLIEGDEEGLHFADYYQGGETEEVRVNVAGHDEAVEEYLSEEERLSDDKSIYSEYFGPGSTAGPGSKDDEKTFGNKHACSYGHKKIESEALDPFMVKHGYYTNSDIKGKTEKREHILNRIYFGNWLRDYSQIIDPMILCHPTEYDKTLKDKSPYEIIISVFKELYENSADIRKELTLENLWDNPKAALLSAASGAGPLFYKLMDNYGFLPESLAKIIHYMAKKEFDFHYKYGDTYDVTLEKLGGYIPEEHIDNPKGLTDRGYNLYGSGANGAKYKGLFREAYKPSESIVDSQTWLKSYIVKGKHNTKKYANEQLEKAYWASKDDDRYRHLGQALHALEDYYAHSNFIEVAMRMLGDKKIKSSNVDDRNVAKKLQQVFPWTKIKKIDGKYIFPIVTGTFAAPDTVACFMTKWSFSLQKELDCENIDPLKAEGLEFILNVLEAENIKYDWIDELKKNLERARTIAWNVKYKGHKPKQEEYNEAYQAVLKILKLKCEYISKKLHFISMIMGIMVMFVARLIDDVQSIVADEIIDPTHTQLAKDYDDHPIHDIAAICAKELVAKVGGKMLAGWKNKKSDAVLKDIQETAAAYLIHPEKIYSNIKKYKNQKDLVETTIWNWCKQPGNRKKIGKITDPDFFSGQCRKSVGYLTDLRKVAIDKYGKDHLLTKALDYLIDQSKKKNRHTKPPIYQKKESQDNYIHYR